MEEVRKKHVNQVELKMRKLPKKLIDIDNKLLVYNLILSPCISDDKSKWKLTYVDHHGNELISIVSSTIQAVADTMLHELKLNYNEYLPKDKS